METDWVFVMFARSYFYWKWSNDYDDYPCQHRVTARLISMKREWSYGH